MWRISLLLLSSCHSSFIVLNMKNYPSFTDLLKKISLNVCDEHQDYGEARYIPI